MMYSTRGWGGGGGGGGEEGGHIQNQSGMNMTLPQNSISITFLSSSNDSFVL